MIFTPLPLSQTVTLSQTPSPLWSVTYFMDGPLFSLLLNCLIFNHVFTGKQLSMKVVKEPSNYGYDLICIVAHSFSVVHIFFYLNKLNGV